MAGSKLRGAKRITVVGVGIAAATVLVGVALALVLVQTTADVASNEFATTTTTSSTTTTTVPAPSNGLQMSLGSGALSSACGPFTVGPLTLSTINFDLNTSSTQSTSQFLCVKNTGSSGITALTVGVNLASSGEAGCSVDEGTVDPEGASCGTAGELASLLQFLFQKTDGSSNCVPAISAGNMLTGPLSPSSTCVYSVSLQFAGAPTYDQKLAASTDTAQFTIDVTASP